jgi:hypothetical protein
MEARFNSQEYVPVAVGLMATNSDKVVRGENGFAKGKAVLLGHYLFDHLWMMGDKKIPEKILSENEVKVAKPANDDGISEESKKDTTEETKVEEPAVS